MRGRPYSRDKTKIEVARTPARPAPEPVRFALDSSHGRRNNMHQAHKQSKGHDLFDPVEDVIAAVGRGELVVIADDEHRENEGDLVCAADAVTPEIVNFMALYGRGLICATLPAPDLARLGIGDMRHAGDEGVPIRTAFMESVDAKEGVSTGISAADRARTLRVMADAGSSAADLVRPGHIFPINCASRSGVLVRRRAYRRLVSISAGWRAFRKSGVICEILNRRTGAMARVAGSGRSSPANTARPQVLFTIARPDRVPPGRREGTRHAGGRGLKLPTRMRRRSICFASTAVVDPRPAPRADARRRRPEGR
jgi:3,4-dihydroxy-2-butanone 4-phosphate synthase